MDKLLYQCKDVQYSIFKGQKFSDFKIVRQNLNTKLSCYPLSRYLSGYFAQFILYVEPVFVVCIILVYLHAFIQLALLSTMNMHTVGFFVTTNSQRKRLYEIEKLL